MVQIRDRGTTSTGGSGPGVQTHGEGGGGVQICCDTGISGSQGKHPYHWPYAHDDDDDDN